MTWNESDFAAKGLVRQPDGSYGKLPQKAPAFTKKRTGRVSRETIQMEASANELTNACIELLNLSGYKVWRNGNHAVYDKNKNVFRKPAKGSLNGVPDIIGYKKGNKMDLISSPAKFFSIEIKVGKDKMRKEQKLFQEEAASHNATYLIITKIDELIKFLNLNK